MAQITLSNLAHTYTPEGGQQSDFALKEMNHIWHDGGAYALLGPSGCGKTTLLNIISGLIKPSHGRVFFGENDVTDIPAEKRNIAQVFQFPVVYDTMTVRENLAFPLKNRGGSKVEVQARVAQVAKMIGLDGILDIKARGLGADIKQKISLGRGMVRESVNAILFDEPLTVIDPHMKWELRTQLKSLHREFGHTMIYVTHDQTEALTFAENVVMLYEGEVVQIGSPEALFESPQHTFVGHFIGSPGMNLMAAKVQGNHALVGGHAIPLRGSYGNLPGYTQIGIRPEYIEFCGAEGLPCRIDRVEDIGHRRIVRTEAAGVAIDVVMPAGAPIDPTMTYLHFPAEKISVYKDHWRIEHGWA